MSADYGRQLYRDFEKAMARLEAMEAESKSTQSEIRSLNTEVKSLRNENDKLKTKINELESENSSLKEHCDKLEHDNSLLKDDNERMKRILNNNSDNSSNPPSSDPPGKAPNTYNARKNTGRKPGGQKGHSGSGLSRAEIEKKIDEGRFTHSIEHIGDEKRPYVTRYLIDLDIQIHAKEIRIHEDAEGRFNIPDELRGAVTYGDNIKAIAAYLYSEGVVSIERIADFLRSLSGDEISISSGTVYSFCRSFSEKCGKFREYAVQRLLASEVLCTDATPVSNNGRMNHIRNFSTDDCVLFSHSVRKDITSLGKSDILSSYAGILVHDHETALYRFGTGHAECNVHIERYLRKNSEEAGNSWSRDMISFLEGMNHMRKELTASGESHLPEEKLAAYRKRYDEIIEKGRLQNKSTGNRLAKKEEKTLLNRLAKYKDNHLMFLKDFRIPYSNNMSEKDLRIIKNRDKMSGGFRTEDGVQMFCSIISFIETAKRQKLNILKSISELMKGKPVMEWPALSRGLN